jgi:2,4-dienoyl-CoA reductase (NADPH2)
VEIIPVTGKRDLQTFLDLPYRIYRGDPHWVPPLLFEQRQLLTGQHPFFEKAEIRLFLAKQGKKVTIVGREKTAGFDINPSFKWRYLIYMRQNGIVAYNDCDIVEVTDNGVIVETYDGYHMPVACDTIVVSEREPNDSLKKAVQSEGIELFVIGDALVPRNLSSAVHDGFRIGLRI